MRQLKTPALASAAILVIGATGLLRAAEPLRILDDTPKVIVVNGYSTSFQWPDLLQAKLDAHYGGKRVLEVRRATKGGTPIAKWMDVKTGRRLPAWKEILSPALDDEEEEERPVIVLAQQSLQWAFGDRTAGIRDAEDHEKIAQGADILQRYAENLLEDGAALVMIAMHIYKKPMEPEIGNERLALAELMARKKPGIAAGPDVWEPTKEKYPDVFARDGLHPNEEGAKLMAEAWFTALQRFDKN